MAKYVVGKQVIIEWLVVTDSNEIIARCSSQGIALNIAGLYNDAEARDAEDAITPDQLG